MKILYKKTSVAQKLVIFATILNKEALFKPSKCYKLSKLSNILLKIS